MACENKATSTIGTELQLNVSTTSIPSWTKFYPIKSYSGFGNEPETIDVTTMDAEKYTQKIRGLTDLGNLTFDVNSSRELVELYNSVKGDVLDWRVIRKQTGEYHRIQGEIVYNWADGSVNDGNFGTLTIIPCEMSDVLLEALQSFNATAPSAQTVAVGATKDVAFAITSPSDSMKTGIAIKVSDPTVVSVSAINTETGATISLAGRKTGSATATITLSRVGYVDKQLTFSITVSNS